jgi:hypothetical protein
LQIAGYTGETDAHLLIVSGADALEVEVETARIVTGDFVLAELAQALRQRPLLPYRRAVVCLTAPEARLALAAAPIAGPPPRPPRVAMLFPAGDEDVARDLVALWARFGVVPAVTYSAAGAVTFCAPLFQLLDDPDLVLLEVGPGRTLSSLARKHPRAARRTIVPSLGPRRDAALLEALAALLLAAVPIDEAALRAGPPRWP